MSEIKSEQNNFFSEQASLLEGLKTRSDSYSSYEDSKLKLRRSHSERSSPIPYVLSPTLKDVPTELPPAIPAMLSKAKVLIKKKLTPGETGADNPIDVHLSQAVSDQNKGEVTEDEDEDEAQLPRPVEVDELENVTMKVR